ncbi:L-lysine exporter family protein LysE/ArgO [Kushneria sinocarnis]|uniref:L-lysine exporter family protein LysE/ArgO n=1 Tax=Kushneria sinocarnis TaxID=595502 RepID=A0A420WU78_9GAMM|nr:LysE/ArgO family amino acid transporter [Kushneria sinocarnis]RKQ96994.1 L-lysine exporter family protein LysE/ArgO [Kushneria sinocarnis]
MHAFMAGFGLGLSLILAIGAQNAFVLRQGLRREHVLWICVVCALSDAVLILAGVFGFAALVERFGWLAMWLRYAGAAFLFCYGARSLWAARYRSAALLPGEAAPASLLATLGLCLAMTWLNPHVYLDTVVLIGSVSTRYAQAQWPFALGTTLASVVFFFTLGYGASLLRPVFARPVAWRVLDGVIGLTMWGLGASLLMPASATG